MQQAQPLRRRWREAVSNAFLGTREARRLWHESRRVAAQQIILQTCPCCAGPGFEILFDANSFTRYMFVARALKRGKYTLCHHCGVVYAAVRPTPESAQLYYDLFTKTQDNRHDAYPPPSRKSKIKLARTMLDHLEKRGLLKSSATLLHLRCDAGALLKEFEARVPNGIAHGLDYFDPNLRYLRETGFRAAKLNSGILNAPFDTTYDLILSNHIFTHALEPAKDILRIKGLLNAGGRVLFYNEVDHSIILDPDDADYRRADIIHYHKQLFTRDSFERFLNLSGFDFEFVGHRGGTLIHIGWVGNQGGTIGPVPPPMLDQYRALIYRWRCQIDWRRPLVMARDTAKWLLIRPHGPGHV